MSVSIGVNMRVTGHYSQGSRRHMEDKFSVAYQQTEDERDLEYAYFGIFDGHGGTEAAAYAKDHLMEAIVKQKHFWADDDADVLKAIRNGYMITHMNMWKELENWPKEIHGLPSTAGTTATVAFIRRGKIYIGHVGDSAIVLGYQVDGQNEWKAMPLTVDHKPESEAEMTRIIKSGGKVLVKAGVPRVVWNRCVIGNGKLCHQEVPFLAIARSLGDHWSYNVNMDEFIVSPDPDVGVTAIDPTKFRCLIFGTDGLWNMISPQEAVSLVQDAQKHNEDVATGQLSDSWRNPSKRLVDSAIKRWANIKLQADNTTVVTVMMDPPGPPRNRVAPTVSTPLKSPTNTSDAHENTKNATESGQSTSSENDEDKNSSPSVRLQSNPSSSSSGAPQVTERTSTVPLPPVSNIPQYSPSCAAASPINVNQRQTKHTLNNYGNPSESYFITRLLNKTQIQNSLQHVYDEILRVTVETNNRVQECDEFVRNDNNNTIVDNDDSLKTVPPCEPIQPVSSEVPEVPSNDSPMTVLQSDTDGPVENAVTDIEAGESSVASSEQECIQINEVSSSSPVESVSKLKKKKTKTVPKTNELDQTPLRNLRSKDAVNAPPKPQTRFAADKSSLSSNNVQRKTPESKVPVAVHSAKQNSSKKLVILQPKPKSFQSPSIVRKQTLSIKFEKKSSDKSVVKNPKVVGETSSKPAEAQPEPKVKILNTRVPAPISETPTTTRVTRSKDNQSVNAESTSKAVKEKKTFQSVQSSSKTAVNISSEKDKDFFHSNVSTRHKTYRVSVIFPKKGVQPQMRGRTRESLENNPENCKENLATSNVANCLLKSAKRRNSTGESADLEPKEKRRTRLDDKRCSNADRPIKDQHQVVSSTETFKSSDPLSEFPDCANTNYIPESSSQTSVFTSETATLAKTVQKVKVRGKRVAKNILSVDVLSEVHSTTLIESESMSVNCDMAMRALRPRIEGVRSDKKTAIKRTLRSNVSGAVEKRQILRSRNSATPAKGTLRKRVAWPQTIRHNLRKRFSK